VNCLKDSFVDCASRYQATEARHKNFARGLDCEDKVCLRKSERMCRLSCRLTKFLLWWCMIISYFSGFAVDLYYFPSIV